MNWKRFARVLPAVALALAGHRGGAHASTITWGAPQTISGDSDVSTVGTLVNAVALNAITNPSTSTVNGVTFHFVAETFPAFSYGNFSFGCPIGCAAHGDRNPSPAPFGNLSSAYQLILSGRAGAVNPLVLTISALTPGVTYQFEWWNNNSDAEQDSTTATQGNSVTLSDNTTGVAGGVGQFDIGTFVGDASGTEVIDFSNTSTLDLDLSAAELRALPIPEPGALLLVGPAVAGLVVRRLARRAGLA